MPNTAEWLLPFVTLSTTGFVVVTTNESGGVTVSEQVPTAANIAGVT